MGAYVQVWHLTHLYEGPLAPTSLPAHVHDHVPRHGLVCLQSCLAQSNSGLPQVHEEGEM